MHFNAMVYFLVLCYSQRHVLKALFHYFTEPVFGFAPIQPIVLRGAAWTSVSCTVILRAAAKPNPEISISDFQLLYEPLNESLLALRLNAEQLATIQPAGLCRILKAQPPPAVLEVEGLVAWALCSTSTDSLSWT